MRALLTLALVLPLAAQTITIPNGHLLQAGAQQGISYIVPPVGVGILNQKAGLNFKTIISKGVSEASIGMVGAALSGIIHIPLGAQIGLTIGHGWLDEQGFGLLNLAAPNPSPIASMILQTNQSSTVTPTSCAEGTILASSVTATNTAGIRAKLTPKVVRKSSSTVGSVVPVMVDGAQVTFTVQGAAALAYSVGSQAKDVIIVDMMACWPPGGAVTGQGERRPDGTLVPYQAVFDTSRLDKVMRAHEAAYQAAVDFDEYSRVVFQ